MNLNIVGGCYLEICDWPNVLELLGSAGRAAKVVSQLSNSIDVTLHTMIDPNRRFELEQQFVFSKCRFEITDAYFTPTFRYTHPLAVPSISPERCLHNPKVNYKAKDLAGESALVFGMIEAEPQVNAEIVVYDPQNAINPKLFSETGSQAKQLALVLNHYEASSAYTRLTGNKLSDVDELAKWLMNNETADVIVIKCGKHGAYVRCADSVQGWVTPFQTKAVYPIGSGDTFAASFYFYWVSKKMPAFEAAERASAVTAFYCETKTYTDDLSLNEYITNLLPYRPKQQKGFKVYLAGPFFTVAQMWLINEAKRCIEDVNMEVFSPYHDVGVGTAEQVVWHDVNGILECDVVYALFDEHDPGTLFEVGMAIQAGKKVIILSENSTSEHLKMYEGTGCLIFKDFATSIYALGWLQ